MTSGSSGSSLDEIRMKHRSAMISSSSIIAPDDLQSLEGRLEERLEISRPLNIEDSTMCCSYPSGLSYRMSMSPYAPHADSSPSPTNIGAAEVEDSSSDKEVERSESKSDMEETISESFDMKETIRAYVDNVSTTLFALILITPRTCARGKVIDLYICRHYRWHENRQFLRSRHLCML